MFPPVLILYQDIIVSVNGVSILIGFADRRLYCTSEDLTMSYSSPASPYCTISGIARSSHAGPWNMTSVTVAGVIRFSLANSH